MFFGSKQQDTAPQAANTDQTGPATAQAVIFDTTTMDFEERVVKASMERPVIVDFWAPWCGPCKQLMPILEAVTNAAGGEVLLAKVNLDENPELAQALRVQSVPTVFAFFGGQPVDAFQGVQSEAKIKEFVAKLIQAARQNKPGGINIEEALTAAAAAIAENDLQTANQIYVQILQQDEANAPAYAGLIRTFIAAEQLEQAAQLVEGAADKIAEHPSFIEVKTALEFAQNAPAPDELTALENAASENPEDHQAQIDLAEAQFAAGQKSEAIDTLLASIKQDREWNEEVARKALLKFFEALGHADPVTIDGRKKLSTILFA